MTRRRLMFAALTSLLAGVANAQLTLPPTSQPTTTQPGAGVSIDVSALSLIGHRGTEPGWNFVLKLGRDPALPPITIDVETLAIADVDEFVTLDTRAVRTDGRDFYRLVIARNDGHSHDHPYWMNGPPFAATLSGAVVSDEAAIHESTSLPHWFGPRFTIFLLCNGEIIQTSRQIDLTVE